MRLVLVFALAACGHKVDGADPSRDADVNVNGDATVDAAELQRSARSCTEEATVYADSCQTLIGRLLNRV
jgi:hypothetical protein